jgi:hypothetical protein
MFVLTVCPTLLLPKKFRSNARLSTLPARFGALREPLAAVAEVD